VLRLSSNQLTALPAEIGQIPGLRKLRLYNNPIVNLPPEICQNQMIKMGNLKAKYCGNN
jgi:Leucine-rich repeat (LRR) protein